MYINVSPPLQLFYGVVYYHENKVEEGNAEILMDLTYESNATRKAQYLEAVTRLNPNVSKNRGFDLSVAFHPDEKLTNDEMNVLAMEVLGKLKFTDTPFIVYRHFDKPHSHFHIVVPTVRMDGTKIKEWNITERAKSTAIALEKKYSLRHTERTGKTNTKNDYMVEHYSVARAAKKYEGDFTIDGVELEELHDKSLSQLRKDYGNDKAVEVKKFFDSQGLISKSERQRLEAALEQYRVKTYSYTGFEKALTNDGFYIRKLHGNNLVYKLPDGKYQFGASKVSRSFTYDNLEKYYSQRRGAKTTTAVDPFIKRISNRVFEQEKTMEGFVSSSYEKGIAVEFITYQDGRAYGVNFTNMKTGEILKGSQVGLSLGKILKKYQPSVQMKNQMPIFYPSILKQAKQMADKFGYLLERTEKKKRER